VSPNVAITTCFRKYFDFKSRASRPEFWWFAAFCLLVILIISQEIFYKYSLLSLITLVVSLIIFIPNLSVGVRRLHDINKSGFWGVPFIISPFLPERLMYKLPIFVTLALAGLMLIYLILIIYWLTLPGDESANDFGPPPINEGHVE